MSLKEQKSKNHQSIQDSISGIFAAKDIYDVMKNLLNMYRKMKEAHHINQNIKFNDKRIAELDAKMNNYTQRLNDILKVAGMSKEGKELMNELTRDLYQAQKESKANHQELKQQHDFYKKLDLLFTQRKNTTNLKNNTQEIAKLIQQIQKEAPNFEKNYANTFKEALKIANSKEQAKEHYQGRSA